MKKNNTILLLSTMLKSTSGWNTIRYSKDKKKKNKAIGDMIGMSFVYVLIILLCILNALGFGVIGLTKMIPELCLLMLSALAFFLTLLKSNAYLFGFKEYDMLMAMPFKVQGIIACKLLYMYIKSIAWYISIGVSMMVVYGVFEKPNPIIYLIWMILILIAPTIPTVIASSIGALISRIGIHFKHKKAIQTIFTLLFIMICIFSRFIIESIVRNNKTVEVLENISDLTGNISGYYFPARWFGKAITEGNILLGVGLVGLSVVIFILFYEVLSRSYRRINSSMNSSSVKRNYKITTLHKQSVTKSIVIKEWKRLFGSTVYVTNACFGHIAAIIIGIVALFVNAETIVSVVTQGAPIECKVLIPAIPIFIFFFVGMMPSTCCSLSLEGKNYWIIQSMPITKKDLYHGKMLFNLLIMIPCMLIGTMGLVISIGESGVEILLSVLICIVLSVYSTCFGMITGIRFAKFEWENEVEVVKQGAAVSLYLLPNMFLSMGVLVGSVVLGIYVGINTALLIILALYTVLALLTYYLVRRKARN